MIPSRCKNIPAQAEILEGIMQTSTQHQELTSLTPALDFIVKQFEASVKRFWHSSQANPQAQFAQLEEEARQLSRHCFASALQVVTQARRQQVEDEWLLDRRSCECGAAPQYKGSQRRTLQTWVGTITWERGYFHCRRCGTGRYPLDEALCIQARTQYSDGVQQGACLLGVQMPFERASHALEALTGINISPKEAERITEARGLVLEQSLREEGQQLLMGLDERGESENASPSTPGSGGAGACMWAVALDAGKVRYEDGWHDTKAGVVFQAQPTLNEVGEVEGAQAVEGSQSYVGETGSMGEAGEKLAAEATRRGIAADERVVCLGDGAISNWVQFELHFPHRVEVLDWYHATEHLWAAGNGIWGQGTREAVRWVKARETELWEGQVEKVLRALRKEGEREGVQGEAAREQIHYFETNKERMRYSEYRAKGYPIGSGTVESACKRLIGGRLKGGGMCWGKGKRGAQGVLTLRAELLSDRWERSWPKTRPLRKVA